VSARALARTPADDAVAVAVGLHENRLGLFSHLLVRARHVIRAKNLDELVLAHDAVAVDVEDRKGKLHLFLLCRRREVRERNEELRGG